MPSELSEAVRSMLRQAFVNFGRRPRAVATMLGTTLVAACGCDQLSACADGIIVGFASQPATPWKVELLVNGVLQLAPSTAMCGGPGPCDTGVLFNTSATNGVAVRVTTPAGVRTTDYSVISYRTSDRGSGCSECRGQASIVAQVP
jgi:hypothetical protein